MFTIKSKVLAVAMATFVVTTMGLFSLPSANAQINSPQNAASTSTNPGYLTINQAQIQSAGLNAVFQTNGAIPVDGSGGAFGYGIITSAGLSAVIVSTTHLGVRDSITQGSSVPPSSIWHNHFVSLAVFPSGPCGSNPQVTHITYQQPGRILVSGNQVLLQQIPISFTGTDALTGQPLTLTPGHDVQNVVSFKLDPKFSGPALQAVCVEDITSAQHIIKN
jgi:hypothetical protein